MCLPTLVQQCLTEERGTGGVYRKACVVRIIMDDGRP